MKKFTIRQGTPDDLNELERISEANGSLRNPAYWRQTRNRMEEAELEILLAEQEGSIAAYGFLNWMPKYRLYQQQNIPEIQDLNVLPDYRRQGMARALIAAFEARAKELGREYIGISFGLTRDFGPAQVLYISLGYVPDGYGVTYDREPVREGEMRPIDDDLCLMLVKTL